MANEKKKCKIDGCEKVGGLRRSCCRVHYWRWSKYGDPLYKKIGVGRPAMLEGGYAIVPTSRGDVIIDKEDALAVEKHCWHINNKGYALGHIRGKKVLLHRFLLNPQKHQIVDHVNHDPLDNRRANLRICTHSQNQMNRRGNTGSGREYKGIVWHPEAKKWVGMIGLDGKTKYLGLFSSQEEAARAYDAKAKEHFGEYAYLNFPQQNDTI